MRKPNRPLPEITEPVLRRLLKYIDQRGPNECWPWTGAAKENGGYGILRVGGMTLRAPRLIWKAKTGEDPGNLDICHSCDHPPCCNFSHLFKGTPLDNSTDSRLKGRNAAGIRNGHARLSDADIEEIRRLAGEGRPHMEIGELFGITKDYVSKLYMGKSRGKPRKATHWTRAFPERLQQRVLRQAKWTPEEIRQIRSLAESGVTYSKIKAQFGISISGISQIKTRTIWGWI